MENKIILYKDDEGKLSVNVRFADEDVWLTRENLAEIYATTPQNISLHVGNIYQDMELTEEGTRKKFFLVRQEGKRQVQREIDHYNLDMIIALGYRVQSPIAVRFRRWATQRLHEYIQKGFTMDDERLKQGFLPVARAAIEVEGRARRPVLVAGDELIPLGGLVGSVDGVVRVVDGVRLFASDPRVGAAAAARREIYSAFVSAFDCHCCMIFLG